MDAIRMRAASPSKPIAANVALGSSTQHPPRRLNLALQGGGAHGAFTWGVLDRLLDDESVQFEGLSGSSAGAMNAVVLADGWLKGGCAGAREALAGFWSEVGKLMPPAIVVQGTGDAIQLSAASKLLMSWASHFSPAQINPRELNPLRDLLTRLVDFEAVRARSPFKLFVAATQATTGKLRIFREHELTVTCSWLRHACRRFIIPSISMASRTGTAATPRTLRCFRCSTSVTHKMCCSCC